MTIVYEAIIAPRAAGSWRIGNFLFLILVHSFLLFILLLG